MDRERYLYRGKAADTGRWVYGYLVLGDLIREADSDWALGTQNMSEEGKFECRAVRVDPDTVGQCTVVKDKKGTWIYEDDILRYCKRLRRVVWSQLQSGFCVVDGDGYGDSLWRFNEFAMTQKVRCEVVGNWHDTPELMESERGPYGG